MSIDILTRIRSIAFSYVYIQAIVVLFISLLLCLMGSLTAAYSFLWGGLICVLPNFYFAYKFFARTGAQAAREIVTSFYISEVVKYIITILLFAIAFKFFKTNKLALFIGYMVAQLSFWLTALTKKSNG